MYRNIKNYEIKFTDCDMYDVLKLSSALSFLEESACASADELGFGYSALAPKNMGFVISNWYIEFYRPVRLGEILQVHTWPLTPGKLIFLRDYELFVGGEKVGVATSRWCMIDTQNYRMLPVSAFFKEGDFDDYNTERSLEFSAWKIGGLDQNAQINYSRTVKFSDYDHYFHVNNTKYADFLLDAFAVEELAGRFVKSAQINYVKQCKENENLDFYRFDGDGTVTVEGRSGGETRVLGRLVLGEL